jgi:hypothetical protein
MWNSSGKAKELIHDDVFYISSIKGSANISKEQISLLREQPDVTIAVINSDSIMIGTENRHILTNVVYTDADYINAINLSMIHGAFFSDLHSYSDVIVLSESLAWVLFGNTHASGNYVYIGGVEYEVLGVAELPSFLNFAWLPIGDENAESLFFIPWVYNRINSYRESEALIHITGMNRWDFQIVDLNEYIESITRRFMFAIYIFGIIILFWLFMIVYRKVLLIEKEISKSIELKLDPSARKEDEIPIFSNNTRFDILLIFIMLILIIIIIYIVNFEMWVPGFYGGGINQWFITFTNIGLLSYNELLSPHIIRLSELNTTVNIWFVIIINLYIIFILISLIEKIYSKKLKGVQ